MASDELKEIRKAMTKEAIREHQMARTGGTQTDLFTCSKCRKKNCTYTQVCGPLRTQRPQSALWVGPPNTGPHGVNGARAGAQAREWSRLGLPLAPVSSVLRGGSCLL